MVVPGTGECFHCLSTRHWRGGCPLLTMPENKDHHEARIATVKWRLGDGEIGPIAKARIIKKEKELWKERQRELARK